MIQPRIILYLGNFKMTKIAQLFLSWKIKRLIAARGIWSINLHFTNRRILCLGVTKDGMPKHPLYLKGDTPLIPWSAP